MLQGKKILVGVSGGIAAYKINHLVRLLVKQGAVVKCILTTASSSFVSPLSLSTVSKNEVYTEFWNRETGKWNNHVELGLWADLFIIAPLTANSLAKMVSGLSDNLFITTYLSARCPVIVAPAMDLDMYKHPTTKRNLAQLQEDGVIVMPAATGELASGLEGEGRMQEPEEITNFILNHFISKNKWKGKKVLITAGPTYEAMDPVRFIGNHSTGKMGFAIAETLLSQGAEVVLIAGPTKEMYPEHNQLKLIKVTSAEEMLGAVQQNFHEVDGGIFTAAVADYRPKDVAKQKIKKNEGEMQLTFVKNPDILKWAGENKKSNQWLCGFALETNNAINNAKEKIAKKNLDFIALNTLGDKATGFGYSTNAVIMLDKNNNSVEFELASKQVIAEKIVAYIAKNN